MCQANIRAVRGYKRHPGFKGGKTNAAAPNTLNRKFEVDKPDCYWVTDFTYSVPGIRHLRGWHKRITNLSEIYTFETGVKNV